MTSAREPPLKPLLAGGCQCGAVRFAIYAMPERIGLCHCRMCQKAAAAPFVSLADVPHRDFAWTRGTPASFRSSSVAVRDFCAACGTPLTFREIDGDVIEILTGAFDESARVPPTFEVGVESKLAWISEMPRLSAKSTLENSGEKTLSRLVNFQHPDHDTPDG